MASIEVTKSDESSGFFEEWAKVRIKQDLDIVAQCISFFPFKGAWDYFFTWMRAIKKPNELRIGSLDTNGSGFTSSKIPSTWGWQCTPDEMENPVKKSVKSGQYQQYRTERGV